VIVAAPGPAAAAAPAPQDAVAIAREKLDAARAAAADTVAQLSAAQADAARISDDIEVIERDLPALQARADELRAVVKQRAAVLYTRVGANPGLDDLLDADGPLAAVRASHLTNVVTHHDVDVAAELRVTATKLQARQTELRDRRTALDRTIAQLSGVRDDLDRRLAAAAAAYDKVQAVVATLHTSGNVGTTDSTAQRCPVDGFTTFVDDFGDPRDGGRSHEGIDMQAVAGTAVVAVADGTMVHDESAAGGHGARLTDVAGDTYYYAHFSHYEGEGRLVAAGDVIGYVGQTGVATGPHLHFEVRPHGGPATDAFPLLLGLCGDEAASPPRS
jgi:murein DD-endopeptidase MepM/ murein hydrolase activator NlpD